MRRILDLYCCAGGAAAGYARAGFEVVGVDREPQPRYPYEFMNLDATQVLRVLISGCTVHGYSLRDFDAVHASPPCQLYSRLNRVKKTAASTSARYENLIPATRDLLRKTGLPYIIENVPEAPLEDPVQLCGTSFGIRVRRHRRFELNWDCGPVPGCDHGRFTDKVFPGSSNRPAGRTVCNIGEYRVPLAVQKHHMQVDWNVTLHELSEMVPPAYTKWLGEKLLRILE